MKTNIEYTTVKLDCGFAVISLNVEDGGYVVRRTDQYPTGNHRTYTPRPFSTSREANAGFVQSVKLAEAGLL